MSETQPTDSQILDWIETMEPEIRKRWVRGKPEYVVTVYLDTGEPCEGTGSRLRLALISAMEKFGEPI